MQRRLFLSGALRAGAAVAMVAAAGPLLPRLEGAGRRPRYPELARASADLTRAILRGEPVAEACARIRQRYGVESGARCESERRAAR